MSWADALNQAPRIFVVGEYRFDILHWAYAQELADNVPHRHTYYEVCLVGRYGCGHFTVKDVDHPIGPGDLFLARPGVVHQIRNTGCRGMELSWVAFTCTALHSAAEGNRDCTTSARRVQQCCAEKDRKAKADLLTANVIADFVSSSRPVVPQSQTTASLWQALRTAAEESSAIVQPLMYHLSTALLLSIAQTATDPSLLLPHSPQQSTATRTRDDGVARLALRYIHDNLDRRLPLQEIAAHVHVSSRHLSRLIGHFSGTSPADYIEQARIDRACSMLSDNAISIKEVAAAVGYADVHHFSRVFRRRTGSSPGIFRRNDAPASHGIRWPGDLV